MNKQKEQSFINKFNNIIQNNDEKAMINLIVSSPDVELYPSQRVILMYAMPEIHDTFYDSRELSDVDFDIVVATKYTNKFSNAMQRGLEFNLSLTSFKNMMRAKKCALTGLPVNLGNISVDRLDNKIGYVKGNVVACHKDVNHIKGILEGHQTVSLKDVYKMMRELKKRGIV